MGGGDDTRVLREVMVKHGSMRLIMYFLDIKKETGCESIELWILDLSKFASVQAFAERFEKEGGGRLDILVENAAVIPADQYQKTEDGWEAW